MHECPHCGGAIIVAMGTVEIKKATSLKQEEVQVQFLNHAYQAVAADNLKGTIPIPLLLSRIKAHSGLSYNLADATVVLKDVCGASKSSVPCAGITLLFG